MRKTGLVVSIFVALLMLRPAMAATQEGGDPSTTIKIAVVDLARALNEVGEGKRAKANLEKEFRAKKEELDNIKNEINAVRGELEKQSHLLSQEALKEKRDEYQRKFLEYQQKAKDYTEQLASKEGEATSKIISKLRTVVEDIAKKQGYVYVFEKSQGGVIYGPAQSDITDEVIKQYK